MRIDCNETPLIRYKTKDLVQIKIYFRVSKSTFTGILLKYGSYCSMLLSKGPVQIQLLQLFSFLLFSDIINSRV